MPPTVAETEAANVLLEAIPELTFTHALDLTRAAVRGGETAERDLDGLRAWIEERLRPNLVWLDRTDYTVALTRALILAPTFAAPDFGTSRQRDLGQLWTDTARGALGEIAFTRFVKERFGINILLDYSLGDIKDYLPADIKSVVTPDGEEVDPGIRISIKASKFNGVWLDMPGKQIDHSDAFVFVRLGIPRQHLFAFLKESRIVEDMMLPDAIARGVITKEEGVELLESLPPMADVPGYICGFIDQEVVANPPAIAFKTVNRRGTRVAYKGTITGYCGPVKLGLPDPLPNADLEVWEWNVIGNFSPTDHYVVSSGNLKWMETDWLSLMSALVRAGSS